MSKVSLPVILIMTYISILSCEPEKTDLILNEEFQNNTLGWIEEKSDSHDLFIVRDHYHISSKDTSSTIHQTSAGSLDKSYLLGLPEKYDVEVKFKFLENKLEDAFAGIILGGGSLEYSFNYYKSGAFAVKEYNYFSGVERTIMTDSSELNLEGYITMRVSVNPSNFKFYIEDLGVGNSHLSVKSWQNLRLVTSKQSRTAFDYIKIKEVKL